MTLADSLALPVWVSISGLRIVGADGMTQFRVTSTSDTLKACAKVHAAVTALNNYDAVVAELAEWAEQSNGFDQRQLAQRYDPPTVERILKTRAVLAKAQAGE